jgi:sortase (surface protein transpeptidase)
MNAILQDIGVGDIVVYTHYNKVYTGVVMDIRPGLGVDVYSRDFVPYNAITRVKR